MKSRNWDGWLQISSTLAVLVGVALVIFELRQNSELIELQIVKDDADTIDERILSTLPENFHEIRQKSLEDPRSLTFAEYRLLDTYLWGITINRWQSLYDLAERGLLKEEVWRRVVKQDRTILANPFGRAYWSNVKEAPAIVLPLELKKAVDDSLLGAPKNTHFAAYQSVMGRLED